jgi:nucleotide-binding universal stress UspA family protein
MTSTDRNHGGRAIDTVVVPLDGSEFSERALVPAAALAARTGAELVVYTSVVNGPTIDPNVYLGDAVARAGSPDATPVATDDMVVHGLEYVVAGADSPVVCMSTHGRSGVVEALLGSVAEEIARTIHAPMLLVGPAADLDAGSRFDATVVCTDGSEVSNSIVPVVSVWIEALHLRAWVVQVLDADVRQALEDAGESVNEENLVYSLARTLMNYDGAGVNWDVLHGDSVAARIVDYAAHLPASLIAMATHGRSGLGRVALGSVAARVVHDAPCPALVTRPSGLR